MRGAHLYGPYGGVGRGAGYLPKQKKYVRARAAYGKPDGRIAQQAFTPTTMRYQARTGGARQPSSVYGAWDGGRVQARDDAWARKTGEQVKARNAARKASGARPARGKQNNVYVGKDGGVYKHTQQGWSRQTANGWRAVKDPRPASERPKAQTAQRQVNRNLNHHQYSRSRGHTRARSYHRAQPRSSYRSAASRSRARAGGGRRGGGGRR